MHTWRKLCFIFLAGLLTASTCERPVEDLDLPSPPSELVLNCSFTPGHPVEVAVTRTQGILDTELPTYLVGADVRLFDGDQFIEQLEIVIPQNSRDIPYYTTINFTPKASTTYTVEVEAPGFEKATAMSFIPESIPFSQVAIQNLVELPPSDERRQRFAYELLLNFDDPVDVENYYHLNVFQDLYDYLLTENGDTVIYSVTQKRLKLMSDAPRIQEDVIIGGLLFANNPKPEGFRFQLEEEIDPEFQMLGHLITELRTVPKEYFDYYSTISRQQNQTEGGPNDPIVIADNIENGKGLFTGFNTIRDSLRVGN